MDIKKKINIGFDIGVASVGWSIIDDDYNIIDMGVRLFDDPCNPKDGKLLNVNRRTKRGSRRRLRRIRCRKLAFKKLLLKSHIINNENEFEDLVKIDITKWKLDNPIQLRVKALDEEITKQQLIFILFNYLHHRGFFYINTEDEDKDNKKKTPSLDDMDNLNSILYPSKQILDFYNKNGYYKDSEITAKIYYERYKEEIKAIFLKQKQHLKFLTDDFQNQYLELFERKREFATGPGSEKSPTPWGMWYINNQGKKVKKEGDNLWTATIGKCTYYPDQPRALKNTATSELFNLFNDLNNIYFFNNPEYKLSKQQKEYLFHLINEAWINKQKQKKVSCKLIIEAYDKYPSIPNQESISEMDVSGYRVDAKKKDLFTELKNYKIGFCFLKNAGLISNEANILDFNIINQIDSLLEKLSAVAFNEIQKKELLTKEFPNLSDDIFKDILSITGLSKRHSLSIKAMQEYLKQCINDLDYNKNQMSFFSLIIQNKNQINQTKYIKKGLFDDAVISPTARRAFNENVKIMNRILELYGDKYEINNITIELARDKNTAEERKSIKKSQDYNALKLEEIATNNDFPKDQINRWSSETKLRLKLWAEQQKRDLYTGDFIDFNQALSGRDLEIDHIIPYQISADDSQSNKILVSKIKNKNKSNLTPYKYFESLGKLSEYIDRVNKYFPEQNKDTLTKRKNLLNSTDPMSDLCGFIKKNLVDTRYASRIILNTFQDFFTNHKLYPNVKIKVIRGNLTNFARYNLLTSNNQVVLYKNRDIYCHHAIDASIVCFLGMSYSIKKQTEWYEQWLKGNAKFKETEKGDLFDVNTGEVVNIGQWCDKNETIANFALNLAKYNDVWDIDDKKIINAQYPVKFSRKLVHKTNTQLSDESIYKFKWDNLEKLESGKIIRHINILKEYKDIAPYFLNDKDKNKLVIYQKDRPLFDKLFKIFHQYDYSKNSEKAKANPFITFMKEVNNIDEPKFLEFDNKRIKRLTVIGDPKDISNIIVLESQNKKAILESLKQISCRIYKDNNNNYLAIPINQKVLKYDNNKRTLMIDENKLKDLLNSLNISNFKYIEINNGTMIQHKETKELYYSIGSYAKNIKSFEVKPMHCSLKLKFPSNSSNRYFITLNKLMSEYEIINVDVLGNIYKNPKNML